MRRRGMFDRRCTIKRLTETVDQYKRPIGEAWNPVGSYPCRLSRKSIQATQAMPERQTVEVYMLYLPPYADVQAGDIAEVPGVGSYNLSVPYKPGNHHIEVQADWEGQA